MGFNSAFKGLNWIIKEIGKYDMDTIHMAQNMSRRRDLVNTRTRLLFL